MIGIFKLIMVFNVILLKMFGVFSIYHFFLMNSMRLMFWIFLNIALFLYIWIFPRILIEILKFFIASLIIIDLFIFAILP